MCNSSKKFPVTLIAAILFFGFFIVSPGYAESEMPSKMPVNPVFEEFVKTTPDFLKLRTEEGYYAGYIPSPIRPHVHDPYLSPTYESDFSLLGADPNDSQYDLRDNDGNNYLTPVRNQGNCGSCWAFAAYGDLENYLKYTYDFDDTANDYSENNLKHAHGFDLGPCEGGNIDMATAYWARYSGPISEGDDPYAHNSTTYCADCTPLRYVDHVNIMPVRADTSDNYYIKEAVAAGHALFTSMRWEDGSYNPGDFTYYYNGSGASNHAVVIVGWDDNKTVSGAPGPGAFIIRNSWGEGFGEDGYFYISYYDTSLAFSSLAHTVDHEDETLLFDNIYQYDPLGATSGFGYNSTVAWGANVFTSEQDGSITAVGIYTMAPYTEYEIYIYEVMGDDPLEFGTLLGTQNGVETHSGYHTISFDTPVPVTFDQTFAIAVTFDTTTADYTYPVPMEYPHDDYSSGASANSKESYISSNGSSWADITNSYPNTNVCIKAFVQDSVEEEDIPNLVNWNGNLVADFGDNGLWYHDGTSWNWMTNKGHVDQMVVWDGKLVVDFGADHGMYYYDGSSWHWMTNKGDVALMLSWYDGQTEKLVVDFGEDRRMYTYDGSWHWFNNKDAVADMTVWDNKLVVDFGNGRSVFHHDGSSWTWMTNKDDVAIMLPWHDGTSEKLVVDFGNGRRIYTYDGSWHWLNNKDDVNAMVVWDSKLVVDFGSGRSMFNYDGASWSWMTNKDDVTRMVPWNDSSGEKLAADFGAGRGMYYYDGSWNWMKNTDDVPEMIAWDSRLAFDFGSDVGIYNYDGTWNWMRNWSTTDTTETNAYFWLLDQDEAKSSSSPLRNIALDGVYFTLDGVDYVVQPCHAALDANTWDEYADALRAEITAMIVTGFNRLSSITVTVDWANIAQTYNTYGDLIDIPAITLTDANGGTFTNPGFTWADIGGGYNVYCSAGTEF